MNRIISMALSAALALYCCRPASAVIVAGDYANLSGAVNDTAGSVPAGFSYWPSVGIYGSGADVYLGNGWAITAGHLTATTTNINGIVYTVDATQTLTNPNDLSVPLAARGQSADLKLIHLQIDGTHPAPSVAIPVIASSAPLTGASDLILDIGRGIARSDTLRTFNASFTGTTPPMYTGYDLNPSQTMRWGDNLISSASTTYVGYGSGNTAPFVASFTSDFTQFGGTHNEFQLTPGDSGGGVFQQVGGVWQLIGVNLATGIFAGQNANTSAVFGDGSYMADLSVYRGQIMAVVPEPSSLAQAAGGAALALMAILRRRRSR